MVRKGRGNYLDIYRGFIEIFGLFQTVGEPWSNDIEYSRGLLRVVVLRNIVYVK